MRADRIFGERVIDFIVSFAFGGMIITVSMACFMAGLEFFWQQDAVGAAVGFYFALFLALPGIQSVREALQILIWGEYQ